jgi:hypothetical protein
VPFTRTRRTNIHARRRKEEKGRGAQEEKNRRGACEEEKWRREAFVRNRRAKKPDGEICRPNMTRRRETLEAKRSYISQ